MTHINSSFFVKSYRFIPKNWQRKLHMILAGFVFATCVETVTVGCIALFISTISAPELLENSKSYIYIKSLLPAFLLSTQLATICTLGFASCFFMIAKNVVSAVIAYRYCRFSTFIDAHFGGLLLKNFLNQDYEWHVGRHSADLITTGSWRQYISVVWYMGALAMNDILLVATLCLVLLIITPVISIVSTIAFGAIAYSAFSLLKPVIDKKANLSSRYEMNINKITSDITQGIKEIIISSNQGYFFNTYCNNVIRSADAQASLRTLTRIPSWLFETTGFLVLCGIIIVPTLLSQDASPSSYTGQLALIAVVAWRLIPAFNRIVSSLSTIRDQLPKATAVIDSILTLPPLEMQTELHTAMPFSNAIALNNISFSYKNCELPALQNVSLSITSGRTVGIIGRSGSGKSTLADIIIGLLDPTEGMVTIDSTQLTRLNSRNWIASVGYVGQNPFFTDGSILENVAFGTPIDQIDRDKLMRCCHMAALDDLISQLSDGVDQPLGERAGKLSGGQRQRVAIARALYRSPQLLILDEATSALDQQSENIIKKTVNNLSGSLTMLIIAHRLTTVEHCDTVVWLENGKIIMDGPPAEVLPHYHASLNAETC